MHPNEMFEALEVLRKNAQLAYMSYKLGGDLKGSLQILKANTDKLIDRIKDGEAHK